MIAEIKGIKDLSMTTNGTLLESFASDLRKAGLQRVNISLDSVDPERYAWITRKGELRDVLNGIREAERAGLNPVKINCVKGGAGSQKDAEEVGEYCRKHGLEVRYIEEMDLEKGRFSKVHGGTGGHCASCNRLRLTSDGKLKPCLFSDKEFDIRKLGYEEALSLALENKPERGLTNSMNSFYNIGG